MQHKDGLEITRQQQWGSREREIGERKGDCKFITENI